jgi:hypothetical protein
MKTGRILCVLGALALALSACGGVPPVTEGASGRAASGALPATGGAAVQLVKAGGNRRCGPCGGWHHAG